jgi:DNA polymerase III epsilon subunit-like protein
LYFDFTSKCRAMHIISTHSLAKQLNVNSALDLKSLTNHFKIELDNHHDAKSDAYACMGIFKKLITEVDLEQFLDQEFNGGSKNELNSETTPSSSRVRKKRNHFSDIC